MGKSLVIKITLIILLVFASIFFWLFFAPYAVRKVRVWILTRDMTGGTRLVYEIDASGLSEEEKKDLSQKMIAVLRRRVDPRGILPIVWRPQGNTRFEIQMPLASAKTRDKRQNFEKAMSELLAENINPAIIMRALQKPLEQRTEDFAKFAQGSPDRLTMLTELATVYDERKDLQNRRDNLTSELQTVEDTISAAGLDLEQIKFGLGDWIKLNEQRLTDSLAEFLGSDNNLEQLTKYVETYAEWTKVVEQLTDPETGLNIQYKNAKKVLNKLNLSEDQINSCLEMPPKSSKRTEAVEKLKTKFDDRAEKIDKAVAAFDEYRPFQGRLDDPKDLQRMLKGAGILEFRILPTIDHPEVDADEMAAYAETLKTKGPKYASDNKYVWCEIEKISEWKVPNSVVASFGGKFYVLASNKQNEVMLHGAHSKGWKLKKAESRPDRMGRISISFTLDERAGKIFAKVTGENIDRPLCILLDGIAISAPNVQARITTQGIITGSFTQTEVADMVNKLNAGSLPARLVEPPISIITIVPSIEPNKSDI